MKKASHNLHSKDSTSFRPSTNKEGAGPVSGDRRSTTAGPCTELLVEYLIGNRWFRDFACYIGTQNAYITSQYHFPVNEEILVNIIFVRGGGFRIPGRITASDPHGFEVSFNAALSTAELSCVFNQN